MNRLVFITLAFVLIVVTAAYLALLNPLVFYKPGDIVTNKTSEFYTTTFFKYEMIRYPAYVKTVEFTDNITIGISNDPGNLDFGIMPAGSSGSRRVIITNPAGESKIRFVSYGNITDMVRFGGNNFILKGGEERAIEITAKTAENEFGNYSGEIDLIVIKSRFNGLEYLLWLV